MTRQSSSTVLDDLASALRAAASVMVLTGAGVSAESGLPTFRDAMTGLWARYRPEDLATPEAFRRDPKLVWDWYAERRRMAQNAQPNAAHFSLAQMQRLVPDFTLATQNVDGLHQRAGSTSVIELHGSLFRVKCMKEEAVMIHWQECEDGPPHCPRCSGLLRPNVVWFGESLARKDIATAFDAAARCDVFLSIGTSGIVEPAASLLHVAQQSGASCAVINLGSVAYAPASVPQFLGNAGDIVPALIRLAWPDAFPA